MAGFKSVRMINVSSTTENARRNLFYQFDVRIRKKYVLCIKEKSPSKPPRYTPTLFLVDISGSLPWARKRQSPWSSRQTWSPRRSGIHPWWSPASERIPSCGTRRCAKRGRCRNPVQVRQSTRTRELGPSNTFRRSRFACFFPCVREKESSWKKQLMASSPHRRCQPIEPVSAENHARETVTPAQRNAKREDDTNRCQCRSEYDQQLFEKKK